MLLYKGKDVSEQCWPSFVCFKNDVLLIFFPDSQIDEILSNCKHSLYLLVPLPCMARELGYLKQNYFGELPDLHDSRYACISIFIQIRTVLLKSISQATLFSLLCFTLQSSPQVHEPDFF